MADHIDEKFFPVPGPAERNPLLPRNKAGATLPSTIVLQNVLTDNNIKWHNIFQREALQQVRYFFDCRLFIA